MTTNNNKNNFNFEPIDSGRNFEDKFHADSETNSQNVRKSKRISNNNHNKNKNFNDKILFKDYVFKNDKIRSHSPSHISNDQIIMHTPDFIESNDKDYFSIMNQTTRNTKKNATPTNEDDDRFTNYTNNDDRTFNKTPTNEPQKPYTNLSNKSKKHNITPTNENNNNKKRNNNNNNNNNDINTSFHSYNNTTNTNNYNGYPYISKTNNNNVNRVSPNSLSNTRLHKFDNLNSHTSNTNYTNNTNNNNKGQYEDDFFSTFFDNTNLVDPFDLNLYGKYYQYGRYQGVNYNPLVSRVGPINGRYNALDDDTFLLERINARIQKREIEKHKTPYFDTNTNANTNTKENKEINLKIDITNNGAKIREFTKSRNSNVTGGLPNITLKPLNNANLNTNRSLDHKNEDIQKYSKNTTNNKQFNNKNQKNSLPSLPTLNSKQQNKASPILNNSLNENDLNRNNNKAKQNVQFQSLKGEEPSRPQNVHDYLYSLSKKGNESSYTEAFKESKKRKGKINVNQPQPHTVNEFRRIANYGGGGNPREFGDSDEHIDKPTKHTQNNQNNFRERFNQTQTLSPSPRDYVLSPFINEKFDNNRQYRQYKV